VEQAVKVIATDNYAREHVADRLIVDGLNEREAETYCQWLLDHRRYDDERYRVVSDDYALWRGMEEIL
jgi:hypothetical protein